MSLNLATPRQGAPKNLATLDATAKQRIASDPMVSSWVGASAGSGKTKVLTDRILRLLLPRENGEPATPPEKILALTFTKAAANEMSIRLSSRLSRWAVMGDDDLAKDMADNLLGRAPTMDEITAARRLFARVVDTPGGLNIMTIHSFCQSVLGRFPIEAGIPPNFKPLEEDAAGALQRQAIKNILSYASTQAGHPLSNALKRIGTDVGEDKFQSLMGDMIKERYQFEAVIKDSFGIDGIYTKLCQWLDVQAGQTHDQAMNNFVQSPDINEVGLRRTCSVLAIAKTKKSPIKAHSIQQFLDGNKQERIQAYADYKATFLIQNGNIQASLADAESKKLALDIEDVLMTEALRVYAFEETLKRIAITQSSYDLFTLGYAVIKEYQSLKQSQGGLDFDDMILNTLSLFKGETIKTNGRETAPWILYKMDGGLDHILVDEAQDTNPEQWEIIRLLASEFFNGNGGRDITRTLFVVGDEKQSIFGFQRAAPEKFGDMKDWFENKIIQSGQKFAPVSIDTSFRSSQTILDAVDCTFNQDKIGAHMRKNYRNHLANRMGQGGVVELWPILKTTSADDTKKDTQNHDAQNEWDIPDKPIESRSGSLQMAQKIGDTIEGWINSKEQLKSYDRPIKAGDILVLVRARKGFVPQLVRILKSKNIPVSGVDRMVLADQLVVEDLCAAAQFGLLPNDDLNLACLLKSPFIGMNEDALYDLCQSRPSSLWEALKKSAHKNITEWLNHLIVRAGTSSPYDFFAQIMQEPCPVSAISGFQAVRLRLGQESLDPLDEFLNRAMGYEQSYNGGLQSFLKWHQSGHSEIKRELQEGGHAVRIMTVHGAKGLQAPIVFMPDTIRITSSETTSIYWPHKTALNIPFYCPSAGQLPQYAAPIKDKIDEKNNEEYRRLLYVAMTRAEERLYVGGYVGKKEPSKDNKNAVYWYDDIKSGLLSHKDCVQTQKDDENTPLLFLKIEHEPTAPPDKNDKSEQDKGAYITKIPSWVLSDIPHEPFPPKPLTPSKPSKDDDIPAMSPLDVIKHDRFKRGNLTHKLLQIIPDITTEKREDAIVRFLSNPTYDINKDIQDNIASEIIAILNHPDFGKIFGTGSMAEVPITGLIGDGDLISGQIDRLLITNNEIYIIDFKTNRPPPHDIKDVPPVYIRQMELYARALKRIYPDKAIRCALLWTDGARLMEIL